MKKYEQIILKFKITELKNDKKLTEVHNQLAEKGAEGFRLINSHIHSTQEAKNDGFRYLFCILEREYVENNYEPLINDDDDDEWG